MAMVSLLRRLSWRKLMEKQSQDAICTIMLNTQLGSYGNDEKIGYSFESENMEKNQIEDYEDSRTPLTLEYSLRQLREVLSKTKGLEVAQVVLSLLDIHAPLHLIEAYDKVGFESKKDITFILIFLLRKGVHCSNYSRRSKMSAFTNIYQLKPSNYTSKVAQYLRNNKGAFITKLLHAYSNSDFVLHCGEVLRFCFLHKFLHEAILDRFQIFMEIVRNHLENVSFEVCSDAFVTLRGTLSHNNSLIAKFLENEHELFCSKYEELLRSESYYTQRQSLNLLNMLLLTPENYEFRMRYLSDKFNLMLIMNQMGSDSRWIRKESYSVFTVFQANPYKSKEVQLIFEHNRQKLEEYCSSMETKNPFET